jgi:predicted phosphoribosyltransferase
MRWNLPRSSATAPTPDGSSPAVGAWYDDFYEVTDEEVRELLQRAAALGARAPVP